MRRTPVFSDREEAKNNPGTLYAMLRKNAKAAKLFEGATENSLHYPTPYLNWGLPLANRGNLKGAKEMFEKVLRLSPNLAEASRGLKIVDETLQEQF